MGEGEWAVLIKRLQAMEHNGGEGNHVRGRNNLKKANWEQLDYMNDDSINKYCQQSVYPHYKFLPMGWDEYGGDHPGTLRCKVIEVIRVPDGIIKE